ncbi:MAG: hypothetical protein JO171_08930 [Paludibacterium sp.]|uniref:type IV pilus assembly protein FimV n=1 Tax=Paludibacterium sp. TaxID=1917523 RepID=UPI0025DA95E5|nr:hypothetical protein [Paludibacterium sp.]MBV8047263.1 hypothetical protein [Paludibacterium sp.]
MKRVRPAPCPARAPSRQPWRRYMLAAVVAGLFACPRAALAGLGPIEVLSAPDEPLAAVIPFVEDAPGNDVSVSLAERARYPILSPYSPSAERLQFSLRRAADGHPTGVLVSGTAPITERELDFAVAVRWHDGGLVREYQVDPRHTPAPARGGDKKPAAMPASHGGGDNIALGKLRVNSAPGAPLMAEVAWLGRAPSDPARLRVRVSPVGEGRPAPEVLALLSSMKYALAPGPGEGRVLQLHSDLPLDVAQLDFRLDVSLDGARAARRYRLTVAGSTIRVAEHSVMPAHAAFRVLRVLPGDTLSAVARRLRHEGISPAAAIAQLYRENPRAFIDGNIDRLLAGVLLRYPAQWAPAAPLPAQPEDAARAAALSGKLKQQEHLLSSAHAVSQALEQKLADLQRRHDGAAAEPAPRSARPIPPGVETALGSAFLAAAAATALALRRRRLRQRQASPARERGTPTAEGMRQWLRYDPSRDDLRYRLLLLLASQNDREGFIDQAEQARPRFDPAGEMWQAVVTMGQELAPDYPWSGPQAAVPAAPEPAPASTVSLAAPAASPLLAMDGLDDWADNLSMLTSPEVEPDDAAQMPEPLDNQALAELFLEMGDQQSARQYSRHPGH